MGSPQGDLERIKGMVNQAQAHLDAAAWDEALKVLAQVMELDGRNTYAMGLMAKAYEGQGEHDMAERYHEMASKTREEAWKRQVEGEVRSRHEVMGGPTKHELP